MVSARLTDTEKEALDALALWEGYSLSELIRVCLRARLLKHKGKNHEHE